MKKTSKLNTSNRTTTLNAIKTRSPRRGVMVSLKDGSTIQVPGVTDVLIDNFYGRLHLLNSGKTVMVVGSNEWTYFRTFEESEE